MIDATLVIPQDVFSQPANFDAHRTIPKPAIKLIGETVGEKIYSETQLVEFILQAKDPIFDLRVDPSKLDALPDGYIMELYANIRYGISRPNAIPLRDGIRGDFTTHYFTLNDYLLASVIFTGIFEQNVNGLLPDNKYEAKVAHDYLTVISYITHRMYNEGQPATGPVVAATHTTWKMGTGEETLDMVYLDTTQSLGTFTPQQAAEHWVTNRTQPIS